MVDAQGRLVGINSMMAGPNVGVAVPVHVAKRFLRAALPGSSGQDACIHGIPLGKVTYWAVRDILCVGDPALHSG